MALRPQAPLFARESIDPPTCGFSNRRSFSPPMTFHSPAVARRSFLRTLAGGAAASLATPLFSQEKAATAPAKIKLGIDNFSVRAMGWKAPQLIEYAASLKVDTLFISDLDAFESLEDAALREVKSKADAAGLALYLGSWSICPTAVRFKANWGTAEEHLALGLRAAKTLGSPVFRVVLGGMEDRKTPGGIQARIEDTVKVLKACRPRALDAGVKVAVENHAGDMHSWELAGLVEAAGKDFVGVNIDSGNAVWTLEDPLDVLEKLGPYTICSSLRDSMIWQSPDGATVQWTAVGDGLVDWKKFIGRWSELCPNVPFQIETISGFARPFPYRKDDFWQHYDKRAEALAHFEALAAKGRQIPPFKAPEGADKKKAEQDYQKAELERSVKYCRESLGLGVRA
jgi:sugar phosphate isomerase/epimerase